MLLLWAGGVLLVVEFQEPDPAERYNEWLSTRSCTVTVGFLENWASRLGIRYFANARRQADSRTMEELLENEDYAVAVASWRDSTLNAAPGTCETWPYIEKAIIANVTKPDFESLAAALARTDAAGFARWEHTLARSAYHHGAMGELASLQEELRRFENEHGADNTRSGSLMRFSNLYTMSPADLGRAFFRAKDPAAEAVITTVMGDHRLTPRRAGEVLLAEWQAGGISTIDWDLIENIARNTQLGLFRKEFLTWFALNPESEAWRSKHGVAIGEVLAELGRSEPAFARELASHLVRETIRQTDNLGSDWKEVTGILFSTIEREPELKIWIDDEAAPDFIWLCHEIDAEKLLNRAVKVWNDSIKNRSAWIGAFIDGEHYRAACSLIEGAREDVIHIRSRKEKAAKSRPASLAEYLALSERITAYADTRQLKGFIHLELAITAMQQLNGNDEKILAAKEVIKAIEGLNEAGSPNGNLLQQTVSRLVDLDREFFEAGRPCFDEWRSGAKPDEIVNCLIREEWRGSESELMIWKIYTREYLTGSELPSLATIIAGCIRNSPKDNAAKQAAKRLGEFLDVTAWGIEESGDLELATWVLKKMIAENQWDDSAKWMFERLNDFRKRSPEADDTIVLRKIYDDLLTELNRRQVHDGLLWLEAVLNEDVSQSFNWPPSFEQVIHRPPGAVQPENLQSVERCFGAHSLRRWIARSLLLQGAPSTTEWNENREHVIEWAREPWLKMIIVEHLDNTFDIDAFERDMVRASPGARRYFSENPLLPRKGESFPKHPSGRDHTIAERINFHLWEAEQSLEIVERGDFFDVSALKWLLSDLFDLAEDQNESPRLRAFATRLLNASFEKSPQSLSDFELGMLQEMQDRAARFAAPENPKIDDSK